MYRATRNAMRASGSASGVGPPPTSALRRLALVLATTLWLVELAPAHALGAQPLSVCAEPDNLPFSQRGGPRKGLYLDLADALGKALGRPVNYVWIEGWQMGAVKLAFTQQQCDVYFGLPAAAGFKAPYLSLTRPFARESYALVVRKGDVVRSLADLAGKHIAVQYGTPPQMLLAVNNFDTLTCDTVPEAMTALVRHEVDAAFLWGPVAGYYNKDVLRDSYQVLPTTGRGLDWQVAIGVRRDEPELREALDRQLEGLGLLIDQLKREYGFPTAAPVALTMSTTADWLVALTSGSDVSLRAGSPMWRAGQARFAEADIDMSSRTTDAVPQKTSAALTPLVETPSPWPADAAVPLQDAHRRAVRGQQVAAQASDHSGRRRTESMSAAAREGRDLFNSRCSHCHGDDAITGNTERSIPDLLRKIPPTQLEAFFLSVVTNGEPDQGMPPWDDALSEEQKKKIFAFIRWRQEHPPEN